MAGDYLCLELNISERKRTPYEPPSEDQRLPLYLPLPPIIPPGRMPYEKGEGLEVKITSDDETENGVIVLDM